MPTFRRPAVPPRPDRADGRRRYGRAGRLTTAIALSAALSSTLSAAPTVGPAAAVVRPPVLATPALDAPAAGPSVVSGVLDRVAVEADAAGHPGDGAARAAVPTSWLRTATGRIPIDADAVRTIPTGSSVAVRFAASQASADTAGPRAVASVTVLARATATPRTTRAAAVHSVTVVLALPAGTSANGTTAAALTRTVNAGVSAFWSQASDGRISFAVSKAVGWTRLTSSCADIWSVWDEVRDRVGFTPGARRHLLVYTPSGAGCPTGLATVGGDPDAGGNAIVGGSTTALLAHELGHNLGLGHSEALSCPGATDGAFTAEGFGSECRRVPYGDWYDVMGISWENLGSLSTAHAYRLGLLPPAAVATARGPLRVTLRPVSTRAGVRSLRIQDPAGPTYVVEYRPARGVDAWLSTSANWRGLRPGVLLRRVDPEDAAGTLLLDATPTSGARSGDDVDVVLPTGRVVPTASNHVSVMVESVTPDAVTVAVAFDGVWPALVLQPRGRLVDGRQITIGQALATWGMLAS